MRTLIPLLSLIPLSLAAQPGDTLLKEGWALRAASQVKATGEAISTPGFAPTDWLKAKVPCTVMGAQLEAGQHKDWARGRNLEKIPTEPYQGAWWYRKDFNHKAVKGQHTRLQFDGINYRANVWLNGKKVGNTLVGAFRRFDLDVTSFLKQGANTLAVEVTAPQAGDFTLGFVDWNPVAPDRNMGLFREVRLRSTGAVSLDAVHVQTKVDLTTLASADLTIKGELVNHGDQAVKGTLKGTLGAIRFEVPYTLNPHERRDLTLTPKDVAALHIAKPRLWWPLHFGSPELYTLKLDAMVGGARSDGRSVTFGIREVGDYITPEGHRGYTVNGKKIMLRGGGWVDDLFLREDNKNLEAQFDYMRDMNMNTVRLEGFWGSSEALYDIADRKGILVMVGWSCQWEWPDYLGGKRGEDHEYFGGPKAPHEVELVTQYLIDQVKWLRNHPSVFVWVLGSDKLPWPEVEKRYTDDLAKYDPTRPALMSCKSWKSTLSGPSAAKMAGPYQYVTPNYWFEDTKYGGAFGFNTETGPGPQVPPLPSLEAMFDKQDLWPINKTWEYHCGRGAFGDLKVYLNAHNARYGASENVQDFAFRTQATNYEGMRAMFEAFGANKPKSTGIIQWMLNAAWPKLYWQLYGHDLMPNGAYYGAKKGSLPLHASYNSAEHAVYLVNDTLKDLAGASLEVKLYDADSKEIFTKSQPASIAANSALKALPLPALEASRPMTYLALRLKDASGKLLSDNFYWLSSKKDELELDKTDWKETPNKSFADFTSMRALPKAGVQVKSALKNGVGTVTLTNTTKRLAVFNELMLVSGKAGKPVLPVMWEDNYLTLLPGETRTLTVDYRHANVGGATPTVKLQGWNLK